MDYAECEFVRGLYLAENRFLEPLITKFKLVRTDNGGVELRTEFNEMSSAVWNNLGKHQVMNRIPSFKDKAITYQAKLDAFLLKGMGKTYSFNDPEFPFRYASGGALPVLWMDGKEYYCLIYREVFPIGWNIANGGCDSRVELLSPLDTVERELREELIIVDPMEEKRRYAFKADVGKSLDRPEFAIARRFWKQRHPEWDLENLEETELPTKWMRGPDSLSVRLSSVDMDFKTTGCFLNINALDFGIEIDRVIRLKLDRDARLLDGEILTGWVKDGEPLPTTVVNAPIGLFETGKLNAAFRAKSVDFRPDRLFWNGVDQGNRPIEDVIDEWIEEISPWMVGDALAKFRNCETPFDLCPVTRSLINRCLNTWFEPDEVPVSVEPLPPLIDESSVRDLPFEVFICSASQDYRLAGTVARFLSAKAESSRRGRPFFSEESLYHTDFGKVIEKALDSARCLVVVTTNPELLEKDYPDYEWRSFHVSMLNRRKPSNAQLVTYISGFDGRRLPYTLAVREWVEHDLMDADASLSRLYKFVRASLD